MPRRTQDPAVPQFPCPHACTIMCMRCEQSYGHCPRWWLGSRRGSVPMTPRCWRGHGYVRAPQGPHTSIGCMPSPPPTLSPACAWAPLACAWAPSARAWAPFACVWTPLACASAPQAHCRVKSLRFAPITAALTTHPPPPPNHHPTLPYTSCTGRPRPWVCR
jgi:hypothetical protein